MANYNTNLTTWGSTGQAYPSGYAYAEDEQPVDAWDNYFNYNVYTDLSHLISLTNSRIESDSGQNAPSSPETAHLYYDTANEELLHWDPSEGAWRKFTREDEIDSDGDGTVDEADSALTYKNNDIDSDGDGSVDNADVAQETVTFEARTDYPSNPDPGQVVFRTDKT